jgi:cephalosporin-C deacetylase-like acetyl esterase
MPYYGPRAEPGVDMEMISDDPDATVANMTQAILDIRRSAAWLASQDEVNQDQVGVAGISLGGITGALAFTAEPRFNKAFLMLAGGDIGRVAWDSPIVAEQREKMIAAGITRDKMVELVRPVDPFTYGDNAKGRQVLMLNARLDEIVPPDCSQALWESFGKPEIFWVDAGHYSSMRFIFDAMSAAVDFFQPDYEAGHYQNAR